MASVAASVEKKDNGDNTDDDSASNDDIINNLGDLLKDIENEKEKHNVKHDITLVAVSKTKPLSMIKSLYDSKYSHRDFGENYVSGKNGLKEKALEMSKNAQYNDIKWHYIGHIQSNDINKLVTLPNLWVIETLDNEKHCKKMNDKYKQYIESKNKNENTNENKENTESKTDENDNNNNNNNNNNSKLKVMIQVKSVLKDKNIKETKSGILYPNNEFMVGKLAKYIINDCKYLQLYGLMTMARQEKDAIDDFENLINCRNELFKYLNENNLNNNLFNKIDDIQLSMGMTSDWKQAIEKGTTNLRIGSKIFGQRVYSN